MPDNIAPWAKVVSWLVYAFEGACVVFLYFLVRKVVRAFHEGMRGDEEGRK